MAQLGFTSSSEFFAWVAECNASWDGAVAEAPNRTPALAEKLLTEEQCRHETATQERGLADKANERCRATTRDKALADETNERRRAAAQEKALANKANKQRRAAARDKALADEADEQCRQESAERATTLAIKALAKDEHNKDDDDVTQRLEAYTAPLFARVDAIMAKI
jgi:hypothetical protein